MRRVALLALLGTFAIASRAHAGGTTAGSSESSSSGSESSSDSSSSDSSSSDSSSSDSTTTTDTTGTDTTGTSEPTSTTDDTGTTSDTSGVVDDTTGSACSCATGDESITIDTPADGANVDAPFLVTVDVVPRCPCFDCSCAAEDFEYAQLFLDSAAWGGPCYASPCEWEVTATLGSHELLAAAQYPAGEATTSIDVFVVSVDAGTTTDIPDPTTDPTTASASDTSTGYAGEAVPSGGCGCASDAGPGGAHGLASVLLVVLGACRRRRR